MRASRGSAVADDAGSQAATVTARTLSASAFLFTPRAYGRDRPDSVDAEHSRQRRRRHTRPPDPVHPRVDGAAIGCLWELEVLAYERAAWWRALASGGNGAAYLGRPDDRTRGPTDRTLSSAPVGNLRRVCTGSAGEHKRGERRQIGGDLLGSTA